MFPHFHSCVVRQKPGILKGELKRETSGGTGRGQRLSDGVSRASRAGAPGARQPAAAHAALRLPPSSVLRPCRASSSLQVAAALPRALARASSTSVGRAKAGIQVS